MTGSEEIGMTVVINIPHPHGGQDLILAGSDLKVFLRDRVGYVARLFGVTHTHYRQWADYLQYPQCHAATRSGRQCRNMVATSGFETPNGYDPGATYLCKTHEDQTEKPILYRQGTGHRTKGR